MKTVQLSVVAAAVAIGSIALASPADAEPLSGTYEVTDPAGTTQATTAPWVFTPCGSDCTQESNRVFHLQGNSWVWHGTTDDGMPCDTRIDATTLSGTTGCVMQFQIQLHKVS